MSGISGPFGDDDTVAYEATTEYFVEQFLTTQNQDMNFQKFETNVTVTGLSTAPVLRHRRGMVATSTITISYSQTFGYRSSTRVAPFYLASAPFDNPKDRGVYMELLTAQGGHFVDLADVSKVDPSAYVATVESDGQNSGTTPGVKSSKAPFITKSTGSPTILKSTRPPTVKSTNAPRLKRMYGTGKL